MKLLVVIAAATVAVVLSAASSNAGATRSAFGGAQHHLLGLIPHHASRVAPSKRRAQTTGFNCIVACSAYEATINQYFTDVAHDSGLTNNVYSVATQYSGITYGMTFGGSYVDGNPYPAAKCQDNYDKYCVTDAQLEKEIAKVMTQRHWPFFSTSALYFIFTPANVGVCTDIGPASSTNQCTSNAFCAYHTASNSGFIYAVEPDAAAAKGSAQGTGCATGQYPAGNSADDTISTISHEENESVTDPLGDGWIANDGPGATAQDENGDLCAYDFGTPLGTTAGGAAYNQVINGHDYYVQLEYGNQEGGCVPYLNGTVTPPDPKYQDGTGPLVLQSPSGTVMTTHTVYAIYWVPDLPANTQLPTITGTPKVGKKLKASHGGWSNSPKYTYRWLRCSPTATSCHTIAGATTATHKLVKADKGHRIEVRVTATNTVGSAIAISAPTPIVTN